MHQVNLCDFMQNVISANQSDLLDVNEEKKSEAKCDDLYGGYYYPG